MTSTFNQKQFFSNSQQSAHPSHHQNTSQQTYDFQHMVNLKIDAAIIDRYLQILQWRSKTYLPIVKPICYFVSTFEPSVGGREQKMMNRFHGYFQKMRDLKEYKEKQRAFGTSKYQQPSAYKLSVQIQAIKYRLMDLQPLSLPQIIYLLKEMIVGYEVLADIFGLFQPVASMVIVDEHDHWKVWVNPILQSITAQNIVISEKEFIYKLILIAQIHCLSTTISKNFFAEIKQFTYRQECSFIKMIQKIKEFATNNKIFNLNKVVIAKEQLCLYSPTRTLTKQKGVPQLQLMRNSLNEAEFINKYYSTQSIKHQTFDKNISENYSLISPQRNLRNISGNGNLNSMKDQQNIFQFYTPRQKMNSIATHLYSPQLQGQFQKNPIRLIKTSLHNPTLNFTISNSKIEQRRRSDKTHQTISKFKIDQRVDVKVHESSSIGLTRQIGCKDLREKIGVQPFEEGVILGNSNKNSVSTEQLKDSINNQQSFSAYVNSKNEKEVLNNRNNQSSFVNFSSISQEIDKNLSVSYGFPTQKLIQNQSNKYSLEQSQNSQWKNISGLFSDTTTIRQLKTSITIKQPKDRDEERKYVKDINLKMLNKMCRNITEQSEQVQNQTHMQCMLNTRLNTDEQYLKGKELKMSRDSQEEGILIKPAMKYKPTILVKQVVVQIGGSTFQLLI